MLDEAKVAALLARVRREVDDGDKERVTVEQVLMHLGGFPTAPLGLPRLLGIPRDAQQDPSATVSASRTHPAAAALTPTPASPTRTPAPALGDPSRLPAAKPPRAR
ncbi:hypothetical protein BH24ACT4_BH24ACT4_00060 [soil metagenome]